MHKWYPQKSKNRFCNNASSYRAESFLFETVPSIVQSIIARITRNTYDSTKWSVQSSISPRSSSLQITWIGHATFLIQLNGYNIITDPIFGNILSPFFSRLMSPGIAAELLPPIDYVLISHNHRDHMDKKSLYMIKDKNPQVHILVPQGDKAWFDYHNFTHCNEYSWWQELVISPTVRFTFLPAVHWSQRYIFDQNRSLWGSWMISHDDQHIYFAGDTAYGDHFAQIAHEFQNITTALLPIGPGEPSAWMQHNHLNSETAVQAFETLQAHHFIPMHWGTFSLGSDQGEEPIIRLQHAWKQKQNNTANQMLHLAKAGEPISLPLPSKATQISEGDKEDKQQKQYKEQRAANIGHRVGELSK